MRPLAVLLVLLGLALPARGEEQIHIDIRGSAGRDYQVAVQRFVAEDEAAELRDSFHAALVSGLAFSGLLKVVPSEAFLEPEETVGFGRSSLACDSWRGIGADALVQGRLEVVSGRLRAHVKIWDTIRCRLQGEQARKDVEFGLELWIKYFREIAALPLAPEGGTQDLVAALNDSGLAVIGTVDDMIEQLERLEQQSGGYGCFMNMAHEWADRPATLRSYELIARYVMPHFQSTNSPRELSMNWAGENRPRFIGAAMQAIGNELQKHTNEQAEKNARADAAAKG